VPGCGADRRTGRQRRLARFINGHVITSKSGYLCCRALASRYETFRPGRATAARLHLCVSRVPGERDGGPDDRGHPEHRPGRRSGEPFRCRRQRPRRRPRVVAYGAGSTAGSYRFRTATDGIDCGIVAFGGDPTVGVLKSCFVAPAGGPAGYTGCSGEGGSCAVTGPTLIAYGAAGDYAYRLVIKGLVACTNGAFGRDPLPGVLKSCYLPPAGGPPGWTGCAAENGICAPGTARTVLYGARGAFYARWQTGPVNCTSAELGGDPIPGVAKAGYLG
jgi:hypothetical protein